MEYVLEAEDIWKTYTLPIKVEILKGVDLKVRAGESVSITGRSGEGKSTLLHILGTLESPCKGKLRISGQETTSFNQMNIRNRFIGFVFQSFYLLEDLSCLDNVLMPAKIARRPSGKKSVAFARAMSLLERVGLSDRAGSTVKLLSGGERQRVAIARALCNDPDIILADEPTGNLDHETAKSIQELLFDEARKEGKALVLVTHDLDLARCCDRQVSLENGQLA